MQINISLAFGLQNSEFKLFVIFYFNVDLEYALVGNGVKIWNLKTYKQIFLISKQGLFYVDNTKMGTEVLLQSFGLPLFCHELSKIFVLSSGRFLQLFVYQYCEVNLKEKYEFLTIWYLVVTVYLVFGICMLYT